MTTSLFVVGPIGSNGLVGDKGLPGDEGNIGPPGRDKICDRSSRSTRAGKWVQNIPRHY